MAELLHDVTIAASPAKVYAALTTQKGLRSWWTRDTTARARVGSEAVFGFSRRAAVFRMRIAALKPGTRVEWHCTGEVAEWKGTRLTWDLERVEGGTRLRFAHARWRSTRGSYAACNTTWGELMHRLKAFAEGGRPCPRWSR